MGILLSRACQKELVWATGHTDNTYTHDNASEMLDITNSSHSNHHHHHHHHVTSYALIDLLQPPIIVSYKGPPSHLYPFGLYFKLTFSILLLFMPVTCSSQIDLYFLSFLSTSSTFNSTKISSFLLWSNLVNSQFFRKISIHFMSSFLSFFWGSKFHLHIEWGKPVHYMLLFFKISGSKLV
jgi:hypothetical protein